MRAFLASKGDRSFRRPKDLQNRMANVAIRDCMEIIISLAEFTMTWQTYLSSDIEKVQVPTHPRHDVLIDDGHTNGRQAVRENGQAGTVLERGKRRRISGRGVSL